MTTQFDVVTVDAVNADALARFWAAALGLCELQREDEGGAGRWIVLGDAQRSRRLGVQRIVGLTTADPQTSGSAKARWHLDLACALEEIEAECDRLMNLGATLVRPVRYESYGAIAALADPEGNLFDLCAYVDEG